MLAMWRDCQGDPYGQPAPVPPDTEGLAPDKPDRNPTPHLVAGPLVNLGALFAFQAPQPVQLVEYHRPEGAYETH